MPPASSRLRRIAGRTGAAVLLGAVGLLAGAVLTHRVSYVVTNGVSMQPLYHAGDLVVVARRPAYRVGDIVAYPDGSLTLLHRIISGDAGGFTTKGDNNSSIDPRRPTSRQVLGRAVLHVPAGGKWLRRLTSPAGLGAIACFLLLGADQTVRRRRRRTRRGKREAVAADSGSRDGGPGWAQLSAALSGPGRRAVAGAIGAAGLLGAVLGAAAWIRPATVPVAVRHPPARTVTFSYTATVPPSAAYDGTTVRAPEPVFRKVTDSVEVTFGYEGPPGTVAVDAVLSTTTGWRSTVPLATAQPITGRRYDGAVRLDLAALDARGRAGAAATGLPADEIGVTVMVRITDPAGPPFAARLRLRLTRLQLTTTGDPFVVQDTPPPPTRTLVPRMLRVGGRQVLTVSAARTVSVGLLLAACVAAAAFLRIAQRTPAPAESDRIRRRYPQLLVEVEPTPPAAGRPVVQVAAFSTLARLAERYGLLVLESSAAGSTTYTLHDDTVTYQYRTGTPSSAPEPAPAEATLAAPTPAEPSLAAPALAEPAPAEPTAAEPEPADAEPADADAEAEPPPHWQLGLPDAQDPLTELANCSLFESEVQYTLDNGDGQRLCLMLIELDGIDGVTAVHGTGAADALLIAAAERLRRAVRPSDLVARLDAARFAVLLEDVTPEQVTGIAARMVRVIRQPLVLNDTELVPTPSLGTAHAGPGDDAGQLMARATAALAAATTRPDAG
jgi:signal peptidase I